MIPPKTSILLVDDQPQRLLTYVAILDSLDLNIVEANSGEEALQTLDHTDFAAILLDVKMPGLNGFEAAGRIREHSRGYRTPIIFVTGVHVSDLDRIRGYEMGAADYIFVPIVPEILRAKIRVLVQLHEQHLVVTRLNERLLKAYEQLGRAHKQLKAENLRELKNLNGSLSLTNSKLQAEIGDRMDAERKLKEAARRKDEFISILAHELRNPLSAIQSGVEVMQLPSLPENKVEWAHKLVQRQVEHLVRLIDDLLDVSRVTSGRVHLQREVIDLRQVLEHSIDSMRARIEERKHSLTIDLPDEPLHIDGDAVRLGQVFANLLANAAKYMEHGGKISVSAGRDSGDPGRVVVRVTDAGSGLPRDMLEHVFELFAQAQPAGGRTQSGLGIGLALARRLVELHDGEIRADSEGVEKGSTFTVELPLTDASPSTVAPKIERDASCPLRLLVIDDNVDAAAALVHLLNQLTSHEVRVAYDGLGGIETAVEFRPDVVFLDIGLPDIDGYEVARQLSKRPELDHAQIVALTGFGADQARAHRAEGYFYRFLTKPVAFLDLETVLSQAAERKDCSAEAAQPPTDTVSRSRQAGSGLS
jgi:signal transduction histidine kinase